MLLYETALKLKKAGFSQYPDNWQGNHMDDSSGLGNEQVYVPTLSELIEACGESFGELRRDIGCSGHCEEWTAKDHYRKKYGMNFSPEEAVAKLWLQINKK